MLQISYVDVGNLKQQFVKMSEVTIFITSPQSDLEELTCEYQAVTVTFKTEQEN